MKRHLSGMRAIVTGASSGVGRAIAMELHDRGVRVLATARRGDRLLELAEACRRRGRTAPMLQEAGDITDATFRSALVRMAREQLGGLDLLVAAAGSGAIGGFADMPSAAFRAVLDIDLLAPAELVRAAVPHLAVGRDPVIVLVGSILGYHPLPLHAAYCAAKAGIASLAGSLRQELSAMGIDVLLASLGPTESEFWDALIVGERPAWSRGRPLPADATARSIAAAIERRRREVIPGWKAKGFVFAARHAGWIIDAVVSRASR